MTAERYRQLLPQSDECAAPNSLKTELAAYDGMRAELEAQYTDEWVIVHGDELAGVDANFQDAARDARQRFGYGPYLIRQVAPTDWLEYAKDFWRRRYGNC